jgi:dsDNA-specific endonuclease/ATPase MutS2
MLPGFTVWLCHVCTNLMTILLCAFKTAGSTTVTAKWSCEAQAHAQAFLHRHPLQEHVTCGSVRNSFSYPAGCDGRLVLLTGPNASGKSVLTKQLGLIFYLAHIGSAVPAASATLTILDGIYGRIHSRDSVSLRESTFAGDLKLVSRVHADAARAGCAYCWFRLYCVDEYDSATRNSCIPCAL